MPDNHSGPNPNALGYLRNGSREDQRVWECAVLRDSMLTEEDFVEPKLIGNTKLLEVVRIDL